MDANNIGQGKTYSNSEDAAKAEQGAYTPNVPAGNLEERLPQQNFPVVTPATPFVIKG